MAYYDESESMRSNIKIADQNMKKQSHFQLSQQQRTNINKRLPRGFFLIKKSDYERQKIKNERKYNINGVEIDYNPQKRQTKIDLNNPLVSTIQQNLVNKFATDPRKAKMVIQSVQGRNRQMEKIKNIIQRFRKYHKYPQLANFLNKIGLMQALNQIEFQNKKALLNIDTFRQRYMLVLQTAKNNTFQQKVKQLTDQMIQVVQCYAQQARKAQFQNNIQNIQKSIDKITRYVSQSNMYMRKRKKGDKVQNNYSQKQILYIGKLIQKLPTPYLIGIIQIIEQKPVTCHKEQEIIDLKLDSLTNRKLKDIQLYVKGKLALIHRSRERKIDKIRKKRQQRAQQLEQDEIKKQVQNQDKQDKDKLQIQEFSLGRNDSNSFLDQSFRQDIFNVENKIKQEPDNKKISQQQKHEPNLNQQEGASKIQNIQPDKQNKDKNSNKDYKKQNNVSPLIQQQSSIDQNDSSDSSMITDQDQSDF